MWITTQYHVRCLTQLSAEDVQKCFFTLLPKFTVPQMKNLSICFYDDLQVYLVEKKNPSKTNSMEEQKFLMDGKETRNATVMQLYPLLLNSDRSCSFDLILCIGI